MPEISGIIPVTGTSTNFYHIRRGKHEKRVLTALLAVIMVISLGTVSALAEGPTEVGTFDDLTTALAAGGEIKLTADIELTGGDNGTGSVVVPANVTVRLDLNGYKLRQSVLIHLQLMLSM